MDEVLAPRHLVVRRPGRPAASALEVKGYGPIKEASAARWRAHVAPSGRPPPTWSHADVSTTVMTRRPRPRLTGAVPASLTGSSLGDQARPPSATAIEIDAVVFVWPPPALERLHGERGAGRAFPTPGRGSQPVVDWRPVDVDGSDRQADGRRGGGAGAPSGWTSGGGRWRPVQARGAGRPPPGLTPAEFAERWRAHAGTAPTAGDGPAVAIPERYRGTAYVQDHPVLDPRRR